MLRVSECDQFYEWGSEPESSSGELEAASQYNLSHYTSLCKIDGKRCIYDYHELGIDKKNTNIVFDYNHIVPNLPRNVPMKLCNGNFPK